MGFRERSAVVLLLGNEACWLVPSVTCGAVGAKSFRVKVSGLVVGESMEL
jgi:hypothetical protein